MANFQEIKRKAQEEVEKRHKQEQEDAQKQVMMEMLERLNRPVPAPQLDIGGLAEAISSAIPQQQPQTVVVEQKEQLSAEAIQEIVAKQTQEVLQGYRVPELPDEPENPHIQIIREELDTEGLVSKEELDKILRRIDQAIMSVSGGGKTQDIVTPENTVVVNRVDHFPEPIDGVIYLADKTNYVIGADVNLGTLRLQLGNDNAFTGGNSFSVTLTYEGTGAMFTGVDTDLTIDKLSMDCPNGTVFDLSKTPSGGIGDGIISITNSVVNNAKTYAVLDDLTTFDVINCSCLNCDQGIVMTGTTNWFVFAINGFALISTNPSFVAVDFGSSVHRTVEVQNYTFLATSGGTGWKGLTNSANITSGFIANVEKGTLSVATPLDGIQKSDIRWDFRNNAGIADSATIGETYLTTTETVTITTAGQFVTIGGGNWQSDVAELFSVSTDGEVTYIGEQDDDFVVEASATLDKVGGGSDQLAMRIFKNLSGPAKTESVTQNTTPTNIVSQGVFSLATNDVIELGVANLDGTSDVNVDVSNLIIRKI